MKFSIKDFFTKCDQIRRKFIEEIVNGKLHFLCSVNLSDKIALGVLNQLAILTMKFPADFHN